MKKLAFILYFLFSGFVDGAAPATHVFFAEMWLDANQILDEDSRSEFIVGTLFPDIRYLGTLNRNETHEVGITPNKIRNSDTYFRGGMRLHVFVDVQREKFVKKYKVESKLKKISQKSKVLFLKMVEDEILWNETDWNSILAMLQVTYPEQLQYVDQDVAVHWHGEMIRYFSQRPSEFLNQLAANHQGFLKADAETIQLWAEIFPLYAQDPYFINYTLALKEYLRSQF